MTIKGDQAKIKIALIDVEKQMRTKFESIEDLAQTMKSNGQLQAIAVTKNKAGRYLLVYGERRLRAAKVLGWTAIDACVCELTRAQFLAMQWTENEDRESLTASERSLGVLKVITELGRKEAQTVFGKSAPWMSKYAGIAGYPPKTRALLDSGKCGDVETLCVLAEMELVVIAKIASKEQFDHYLLSPFERCLNNAKAGQLTRATARDEWRRLQQTLRWAAEQQKRDAVQEKVKAKVAADKKALEDAAHSANANPKAVAQLLKAKEARKTERSNKAKENRESFYRYRMQQISQSGHRGAYVIQKLLDEAINKESEERIVFLRFNAVKLAVASTLAALDLKTRKSMLRALSNDLLRAEKVKLNHETMPPKGWVTP